jgi:hypothetical protein
MNNNRNILASKFAVLRGKKIAFEYFDPSAWGSALDYGIDLFQVAGMSDEADEITKAPVYQIPNNARANEASGTRYKHSVFPTDNEGILDSVSHVESILQRR